MKPSLMVRMVRRKQLRDNQAHFAAKHLQYHTDEIKNLSYMEDSNPYHSLDIYGPADCKEVLPVVMLIHGGGYVSCDKFINEAQGKFFAEKGFRVVNVNYTLQPEADFIQVARELFTALKWIRNHAQEYCFDRERIYVSGDSAGGHYALLLAAIQSSPLLQKYYGTEGVTDIIKGVAASCPMTQIRSAKEKRDMTNRFLRKNLLHGGREADDEYIDNVSIPYLLDRCEFPEVFLMTTPSDEVMYEETKFLHETLERQRIPHVWREYHSESRRLGHAFNAVNPEIPEAMEANEDILAFFRSKK